MLIKIFNSRIALAVIFGMMFYGVAGAQSTEQTVMDAIERLTGQRPAVADVNSTPMPGVFEVLIDSEIYYVHAVGEHVLIGEVYDVERGKSLSAERMEAALGSVVASYDVAKMVVMKPETTQRYITVFTDVDCGFCRRLHAEVPELLKEGIEVRYLAFPRAGIASSSYDVMVSVWCADDQQFAMTEAKAGRPIADAFCDNPVAEQYNLGLAVGISGTPTLILDDGTVIPGYVSASELISRMN